jgi:hypothetical protein
MYRELDEFLKFFFTDTDACSCYFTE